MAFQDFDKIAERRRVERQRKLRKRIAIGAVLAVTVVVLIAAGVFVVVSHSGHDSNKLAKPQHALTKKLELIPRIKRYARKSKNTVSSSRPRIEVHESPNLANFRNDDCVISFDLDFAEKTVIRGRNIELDLLGELDLYGHFQFQGWENLCEMGRYAYPKDNGLTIRNLVGRKLIELTVEKLSEIMGIPCRREHVYEQKVRPQENNWDYWDAVRFLLDWDDEEDVPTHFNAKDLKLSLRLLHLISTYNFLLRGGHR
ncbi:putative pectinesterase/pectinesterase inhibitor 13 [Morella rubra]|uniref:Putative pectinesterase/pectinesterase inhibitor 13 n=1 Tax=Morella rubra TaxID=262757 RepID=A0A6A1VS10_9ROSI|nr:putative pectinesterase/pectinesterase inhibitor 13 [Morella rubra]